MEVASFAQTQAHPQQQPQQQQQQQSNSVTTFALNMMSARTVKLDHYSVKTMVHNIWDKFQDENIAGALDLAEFVLSHASKETVKNYFDKIIEENGISWEQLDNVYNELADLADKKTDYRSKWASVNLIQEWVLPYLLTPVKLKCNMKSIPTKVKRAGSVNILEMLRKEGVEVTELGNHILIPKRYAQRWVDMLEKEGFLIVSVSSWGDDRGVITQLSRGLDFEDAVANKFDPDLVRIRADDARDYFMQESAYDEVQYASIQTNEDMTNGSL